MAGPSTIEWTDATWNPVTGCTKVSAGCDHCYAETIARRFAGTKAFPNGFAVTLHPERLSAPEGWVAPRRVFVNSMSDLFHRDVPDEFIALVFAVMAGTARHTYQVLTKRPARMRALLSSPAFRAEVLTWLRHWGDEDDTRFEDIADKVEAGNWPLANVWLGVSIEDQHWADIRIPALIDTPAAVRFLSCEPLLGPVDLNGWLTCGHDAMSGANQDNLWRCDNCSALIREEPDPHGTIESLATGATFSLSQISSGNTIDWVIAGGESGPGARPMHPNWARGLRDQCQAARVPYFFKQWGTHTWNKGQPRRVGKHAAGRVLDGRTWDEYPGGDR